MRKLKDIAFAIGIALIPAILVFILILFDPLYSLDAMVCDKLYSQMDGFGRNIRLICIDEETLAEYGPLTTWSREKSAELIDYLYEDEEFSPSIIAFDVMFIGEGDSETDNRLADAFGKVPAAVVASHIVYEGKTAYTAGGVLYRELKNVKYEELPYDAINSKVASGYANTQVSKDGFVRVTEISENVDGVERYSFATQIYKEYAKVFGDDSVEPLPEKNQVQFFYSGKPGECAHSSFKDVLDGTVPRESFKDCVVLVGAYAPGLQDSYHSSARRGIDMYGVEINANILNALINGKTADRVNRVFEGLIVAAVLFAYTLLARKMKMYPSIIVGVWILIAAGITARVLATHGHIISFAYITLVCILIWAGIIIEKYVIEAVQRRQTLRTFKKYMAPQVIDNLARTGNFHIELSGEKRNVAVLFVDIRGFTSISEILSPEQMVQILNKYLSLTTNCIFNHGGMLDKFIGDATMAIFNAPNDQEDYVYEAVMAGLEMQKRGSELGAELEKEFGKTVSFGVGVHVGDAVVGNIGCDTRMDYTAIGDTVNTASRIEGKSLGGELLISEAVYLILGDRIEAEFKEDMMLKGKKEPVKVYKVLGSK